MQHVAIRFEADEVEVFDACAQRPLFERVAYLLSQDPLSRCNHAKIEMDFGVIEVGCRILRVAGYGELIALRASSTRASASRMLPRFRCALAHCGSAWTAASYRAIASAIRPCSSSKFPSSINATTELLEVTARLFSAAASVGFM